MTGKIQKLFQFFLVVFFLSCNNSTDSSIENCNDAVDNDQDGFIDCFDPDCYENVLCQQEGSNNQLCGNGRVDLGEECDLFDFSGKTCESLGFDGGNLFCDSLCQLVSTACYRCGNGICEAGENNNNCAMDCPMNVEQLCGNGRIDDGEECDGDNLPVRNCNDLNDLYHSGFLHCTDLCTYDYSACTYCGNSLCEAGETALNCMVDCGEEHYCGNGFCEIDFLEDADTCPEDCANYTAVCGNGILEMGEECEQNNIPSCQDLYGNDYIGTVSCTENCQIVDDCYLLDSCGNGQLDAGEECDDNANTTITCRDLYGENYQGVVNCVNCHWQDNCYLASYCGDGYCNNGETTSSCPEDCNSCSADDVEIYTYNPDVRIYGSTDDCGNHPYTWAEYSLLVGDNVLFNGQYDSTGAWLVWWNSANCSADNLEWNLQDLENIENYNCWALCTQYGADICCSVYSILPNYCASIAEDYIRIF